MNENVLKLVDLAKENPELEIVAMVDSECVAEDGYSWWTAKFGNVSVEEIVYKDDCVHIKSEDYDDLITEYIEDKSITIIVDEELEEMAKSEVDNMKWKKVIAVRIQP